MFCFLVFLFLFARYFVKSLKKCRINLAPADIDVTESLDNYWRAIPASERREWIKEESFIREKFGF